MFLFLDLTAGPMGPVRSRTEIRFGCREPGAATFALERGDRLSPGLRLVLLEQEAILRSVLAARSVAPGWR